MTFGISLTDGLYVIAICCSCTSVYFKLQWSLYRCIRRYWVNVEAGDTRRGQRGGDLYETGHPKWKVKIGEDVQRKIEEPWADKRYQNAFNKWFFSILFKIGVRNCYARGRLTITLNQIHVSSGVEVQFFSVHHEPSQKMDVFQVFSWLSWSFKVFSWFCKVFAWFLKYFHGFSSSFFQGGSSFFKVFSCFFQNIFLALVVSQGLFRVFKAWS